jgi:hypothetical protein
MADRIVIIFYLLRIIEYCLGFGVGEWLIVG